MMVLALQVWESRLRLRLAHRAAMVVSLLVVRLKRASCGMPGAGAWLCGRLLLSPRGRRDGEVEDRRSAVQVGRHGESGQICLHRHRRGHV